MARLEQVRHATPADREAARVARELRASLAQLRQAEAAAALPEATRLGATVRVKAAELADVIGRIERERLGEPAEGEAYCWPSRSRCPRCGSLNTLRRSSHGDTQYRVCAVPICRKKYAVIGTPA
jgi:hypothetical protein